jgi:hypothetical protein
VLNCILFFKKLQISCAFEQQIFGSVAPERFHERNSVAEGTVRIAREF